jgi:DNA-binding beta-propeller fold protein YncE
VNSIIEIVRRNLRLNVLASLMVLCGVVTLIGLFSQVSNPSLSARAQQLQSPSACDAPVPNPLAVSTLRWYTRNQAARIPMPSPVGPMTFDGSNMYLLDSAGISKVRATDAATIATFTDFGTLEISSFWQMLFDGQNIWVLLTASDAGLIKLRASDGAFLGSGSNPAAHGGMAFDGQNIWVSARGSGLERYRALNFQSLGFLPGGDPVGLATDGHNVWVADASGVVVVRRIGDGAIVHSIPIGGEPWAIAYDGTNMWVTNLASSNVAKIRAHDFVVLGEFPTESQPMNIVFDGANIWTANFNSNSLTKIRACDGAHVGSFAAGGRPQSLAFDGINVWVGTLGNSFVAKM